MTLQEVAELLGETGFPVAYECFPENEVPPLPFICFINPQDNHFAADGVVYFSTKQINVELYTEKRDMKSEQTVEEVLKDFYYEKIINYIDSEKCYQILYEMEV